MPLSLALNQFDGIGQKAAAAPQEKEEENYRKS